MITKRVKVVIWACVCFSVFSYSCSSFYILIASVSAKQAAKAMMLPITPPSNVRAGDITTSGMTLTWDDQDANVVKYRIHGSRIANVPDSKTLMGDAAERSFSCVNFKANSTYYFRISAIDIAGNESVKTAFKALALRPTLSSNVYYVSNNSTSTE